MRKLGASAIAVLAAVAVSGVMMSIAWAEPSSVVGKALGFWGKRKDVKVLEIRRHREDNSLETVMLKGDTIMMQKSIPPKKWTKNAKSQIVQMKTLREFDIEKVKKLTADAGWAHNKVVNSPDLAGKRPTIRCVTLREKEDGNLEFLVHAYHPATHTYRGAYPVDVAAGFTVGERLTLPREEDPMLVKWGDPIEAEEAAAGEEGEAGEEGAEGEGEKAGGSETK